MKRINRHIVMIGGGDILDNRQDIIFREVFKKRTKKQIHVAYLPIAIMNNSTLLKQLPSYSKRVNSKLTTIDPRIALQTIAITNRREMNSENFYNQTRDLIGNADIVFLPGGDTQLLIDTLINTKLDLVIQSAYNAGKIIIGTSAGALALVETGFSLYEQELKEYHGINLIHNFIPIVHWNPRIKSEKFNAVLTKVLRLEEDKGCIVTNDQRSKILN